MAATGQLDRLLPYGLLATRRWLLAHGMSRHQFDNAVKSGKLDAPARGVVARRGVPVSWQGLAASLHRIMAGCVYVGGLTALEQAGQGHYVKKTPCVHLYSNRPQPGWVRRVDVGVQIEWHSTRRLWSIDGLKEARSLREHSEGVGRPYLVATPEQAFLELLVDVPDTVSFEHADQLMQGLTSLSPRRLDALLRTCRHIKVKRLFFFFAERQDYPWLKHLDRDDYDLGSGKRVIARGGRLNEQE
jgi:hypothetical protein